MKSLRDTKIMRLPAIRKIASFIFQGYLRFMAKHLNDRTYLKWKHFRLFHRIPNLNHPILFNEKLHWLKLNDRKDLYHTMVDKYDVKQFVAEHYSPDIVIPTLGIWNHFDEIDYDTLPNKFILKGSFDSGSYYICHNKIEFDKAAARKSLMQNWDNDYYIWSREWPYHGLKHRIIAEPLIADNPNDLWEFKFFCFEGEPKFYQTCLSRKNGQASLRFYDIKGNLLDLQDKIHKENIDKRIVKPQHLDKMLEICRIFAKPTHFLRVDLYEVHGKIYFGEFTFYENGGWCEFTPEKYNQILGDWIKIETTV